MNKVPDYKYLFCGDSAISVQFGEKADVRTNLKVCALSDAIKKSGIKGITEILYTYRSVMIHYSPLEVSYDYLKQGLDEVVRSIPWDTLHPEHDGLRIPILYRLEGSEIDTVAAYEGITVEEAIRIHTSKNHYVFMMGVQPGGCYAGCPSGSFTIPRKKNPTMKPFASTVTVWGIHTGLSGHKNQAGWYTIGYLPCKVYDHKNPVRESWFKPGMWLNFYEVNKEESDYIEHEFDTGRYIPERIQVQYTESDIGGELN